MKAAKNRPWLRVLSIGCVVAVWGCGADEDGATETDGRGKAWVQVFDAGETEIEFEGAEVGHQYVVTPYALGNTANVDGATSEVVTFNYTVDGATAEGFTLLQPQTRQQQYAFVTANHANLMDAADYEHGKRVMIRLYDPDKGENQNPALWNIARQLDMVSTVTALHVDGVNLTGKKVGSSFEATFRSMATDAQPKMAKAMNLTQATCPVEDDTVVRPAADLTEDSADVAEVIDEEDYCIIIVNEPTTVTTADIKAAMTAILARYKDEIYNDQFTGATGYTFKPAVVVVDFKDAEYWESESATLSTINGVFIPEMSSITSFPMIYMAADLAKVLGDSSADAAKLKRFWHGTLAHEMQHAVSDFYKLRKTGDVNNGETVAIEEGQAHFMEAVFGYGSEVFNIHAKPFFDVFAFGTEPLLRSNDIFELSGRGAAYSLLYYLSSRQGGIEFTDGAISARGGLDFVGSLVKSSTDNGVSLLAAKFGGEWVETMGHYIAALTVDGTDFGSIAEEHQLQEPQTGVPDLEGGTDNRFGFRFNGDGVEDHLGEYADLAGEEFQGDVETTFYGIKPGLYTVKDPAAKLTITSSSSENVGVAVVRVK